MVDGLENDIEEIEQEVFSGDTGVSRRIYGLSREVIEFRRATQPLARVLERLGRGDVYEMDIEIARRLHDVHDHQRNFVRPAVTGPSSSLASTVGLVGGRSGGRRGTEPGRERRG